MLRTFLLISQSITTTTTRRTKCSQHQSTFHDHTALQSAGTGLPDSTHTSTHITALVVSPHTVLQNSTTQGMYDHPPSLIC
jgi:hypothetical protein